MDYWKIAGWWARHLLASFKQLSRLFCHPASTTIKVPVVPVRWRNRLKEANVDLPLAFLKCCIMKYLWCLLSVTDAGTFKLLRWSQEQVLAGSFQQSWQRVHIWVQRLSIIIGISRDHEFESSFLLHSSHALWFLCDINFNLQASGKIFLVAGTRAGIWSSLSQEG